MVRQTPFGVKFGGTTYTQRAFILTTRSDFNMGLAHYGVPPI